MAKIVLGLNLSWAVKRWPMPDEWSEIVAKNDVKYVQFSFDLFDPRSTQAAVEHMAGLIRDAIKRYGIVIHSTFTGLAAYSYNLLAHPDPIIRMDAVDWYTKAIDFTSKIDVKATGGHIGAKSVRDYKDASRRTFMDLVLFDTVKALRKYAQSKGLEMILWEPLPVPRETPWNMAETEEVLRKANEGAGVAVKLNIDVGHQCTLQGVEASPYEWLKRFAPQSPAVHIQQTDGKADRHWPFTEEYNKIGIIKPDKLIEAIEQSGAKEVYLFLEYIPPFEAPDDEVLQNLEISVKYLKQFIPTT
ncbi:TIM barrel protein [Ignisphaera sp. 4213-co]|uniref:TIM barrel protein n=1 Tax=Ignisphaera cupida TaxID=3050454 RepID=A0ABD4Z6V2_9CREN|nr:TIM barrel protein [Ignisphaera sp. 4213-co]MDK6028605.1 TIM barrel protein [Ignisphaera sp. 4213-co]